MSRSNSIAAAQLLGMTLPSGWSVKASVGRAKNATGGTFSHSYVVERDGQKGFLKAFDFSEAFTSKNTIALLSALTAAYENERDVLQVCNARRLSKVVVAIESGDVQVPNFDPISGRVFFLVFELADGDVRSQVDRSNRFDVVWSTRALKDVCLGLWQVHRQMIAHQTVD
jgi:eukaryotic-like serine/threonine-protein kinase